MILNLLIVQGEINIEWVATTKKTKEENRIRLLCRLLLGVRISKVRYNKGI